MEKELRKYVESLIGKKNTTELAKALNAGCPVLIFGTYGSGKTTLARILRAYGYQAYDEIEMHHVGLSKPLTKMNATFYEDHLATRGNSGKR